MKLTRLDETQEWLETDGLGGFAMGTASGIRTRRYHSLLTAALQPPGDRVAVVKGVDAWIQTPEGEWGLTTQRYGRDHEAPEGISHLVSFSTSPWPTWTYRLPNGLRVVHELVMEHGSPLVCLSWRLVGKCPEARLIVRPLLSCTSLHAIHRENDRFNFDVHVETPECLWWRPYDSMPSVFAAATNGGYVQDPVWYRGLYYAEEAHRGFEPFEDLGSPGAFRWAIGEEESVMLLSSGETPATSPNAVGSVHERLAAIREKEHARRSALSSSLHRAADAYIVKRGEGRSIIAGYPWFGDWGRDTFISMRGLCPATGRTDDAKRILHQWADEVSEGMLPNRFTDAGGTPEFNSVDSALWFVICAGELLDQCDGWSVNRRQDDRRILRDAISSILAGYTAGTRHGIRVDDDGLVSAGEPGVQLTWMDAKVGDWVVTPRIGKPVEIQALWINALAFGAKLSDRWATLRAKASASFEKRFWSEEHGYLFDVVDADHEPGRIDPTLRPNQILAIGGLPHQVLSGNRAASVLEVVEDRLWTPLGLRSLAPGEPGYSPRYEGGPVERDGAYHQGTIWPWLTGPFVEAWLRVHGETAENALIAERRFLAPIERHLSEGGIGHVSEIIDADSPRRPRGAPFQAWSVGELIRMRRRIAELIAGSPRVRREPVASCWHG